ncbi:hypothetical protein EJ02DRAFT_452821 [Clathrospora elynae]|uniref:Uncharacterized protein n=1 Tax=Clathrospora elynae TaxID=706981 RepID=A0A6A5SU17_9PLEO|nr:hypothetical protein EJ02DRAFT_452821 [Clathrospora elynae]
MLMSFLRSVRTVQSLTSSLLRQAARCSSFGMTTLATYTSLCSIHHDNPACHFSYCDDPKHAGHYFAERLQIRPQI